MRWFRVGRCRQADGELGDISGLGRWALFSHPQADDQVATSWLLRTDWTGGHVQAVHGPGDLSWDDALAIVTQATGHAVQARRVTDDDMRANLARAGMNAKQVEVILGVSIGLRGGFTPEQARDATTTIPTTLTAWSYDVLRPLLTPTDGLLIGVT